MYGELLLDVTGSDIPPGLVAAVSRLQIRGSTGPGGGRILSALH